jgi:hypothetical protein
MMYLFNPWYKTYIHSFYAGKVIPSPITSNFWSSSYFRLRMSSFFASSESEASEADDATYTLTINIHHYNLRETTSSPYHGGSGNNNNNDKKKKKKKKKDNNNKKKMDNNENKNKNKNKNSTSTRVSPHQPAAAAAAVSYSQSAHFNNLRGVQERRSAVPSPLSATPPSFYIWRYSPLAPSVTPPASTRVVLHLMQQDTRYVLCAAKSSCGLHRWSLHCAANVRMRKGIGIVQH